MTADLAIIVSTVLVGAWLVYAVIGIQSRQRIRRIPPYPPRMTGDAWLERDEALEERILRDPDIANAIAKRRELLRKVGILNRAFMKELRADGSSTLGYMPEGLSDGED